MSRHKKKLKFFLDLAATKISSAGTWLSTAGFAYLNEKIII